MSSKIIHKHSSVITDGKPKIPTENQLEYGELAINYGKGVETISFKNTNNEIVEIKTKNYFDEKILLNSKDINSLEDKVNDIKSTIENDELVTATALSDLDDKILHTKESLTSKVDNSKNISISLSGDVTGSGVTTLETGIIAISTEVKNDSHTHSNYSSTGHTHGTIYLSGDVTGNGSIGSGTTGINISATVKDNSHNHISENISDSISSSLDLTNDSSRLVQGKAVFQFVNNIKNEIENNINNSENILTTSIIELNDKLNNTLTEIEENELVIASAITNLEECIKELEKKINQLLSNN